MQVYIAELKDHVIIQEGEDGGERIVLRDGQDLRELEHHIVTEGGVGHLIIDGQVRFLVVLCIWFHFNVVQDG